MHTSNPLGPRLHRTRCGSSHSHCWTCKTLWCMHRRCRYCYPPTSCLPKTRTSLQKNTSLVASHAPRTALDLTTEQRREALSKLTLAACAAFARALSTGGGPSTVSDTISSPLKSNKPRTLFSSFCKRSAVDGQHAFVEGAGERAIEAAVLTSSPPFFGGIFLVSTQSAMTKFMCLSNARNLST